MDDEILNQLESQLGEIEVEGTDYTKLDYVELVDEADRLRERLLDIGEMLAPRTAEGRELHSQRVAVIVALARRKK